MLGKLRRLVRLRGPLGILVLGLGVGLLTGILTTHAVLAAWTYRDAARRDLRNPGRWALAVLVGGVFAFGAYVAVQRATDRAGESGILDAVRRVTGRDGETVPVAEAEVDREAEPATSKGNAEVAPATDDGGSLATTTARYGVKVAGLGVRGARWAGRRAIARMNND